MCPVELKIKGQVMMEDKKSAKSDKKMDKIKIQ